MTRMVVYWLNLILSQNEGSDGRTFQIPSPGPKGVVLCGRESRVHLSSPYFDVEGLLGHAPRKLEKGEVREAPKVGKFFSAGAILIG